MVSVQILDLGSRCSGHSPYPDRALGRTLRQADTAAVIFTAELHVLGTPGFSRRVTASVCPKPELGRWV